MLNHNPATSIQLFHTADTEFEIFLSKIRNAPSNGSGRDISLSSLQKAYETAKACHGYKVRQTGELYLYHPVAVCRKLFYDGCRDTDVLVAALLHDTVEESGYTLDYLEADFGSSVRAYVEAVTRLDTPTDPLSVTNGKQTQILTDGTVSDKTMAALYIKFADRYHNLQTGSRLREDIRRRTVSHTRSVLIPLARQIGCPFMADQLEDACFQSLQPAWHENVSRQLATYDALSRKNVQKILREISAFCKDTAEIDTTFSRPYPGKVITEIRDANPGVSVDFTRGDLFSFYRYKPYAETICRILSPTKEPLCRQFLHLVQGLLAKAGLDMDPTKSYEIPGDTPMARVVLTDTYKNEIRVTVCSATAPVARGGLFIDRPFGKLHSGSVLPRDKRVRVYTRNGDPMEIERGATVLDLAFLINTELGGRYAGAEVNGSPAEMDYVLRQNDRVTILKGDRLTARVAWFGVLETKSARARLINLFNRELGEDFILG